MTSHSSSSRVKACVECRQQKLRCDASPGQSCSRCLKGGIECIISFTFHRSKRQSKAEMQREIDRLKSEAETPHQASGQNRITVPHCEMTPASSIETLSSCSLGYDPAAVSQFYPFPPPEENNLQQTQKSLPFHSATIARSLSSVELSATKIDDCFTLFFQHYHPILPILNPEYDPNQYYIYSQLVFWVIIAIGARRYPQDPTICHLLASRVQSFAMVSATQIPRYVETVQAMTLLCCWPFPMESIYHDPSLVLSGVATQLAVQNGLHMFSRRQDFAKPALGTDESQDIFRATLWCYCKIITQLTNLTSGLPPYQISDAFDLPQSMSRNQSIVSTLSKRALWAQRIQKIFASGCTQLMNCQPTMTDGIEGGSLRSLIDLFDTQIQDLGRAAGLDIDSKDVHLARLNIRAFDFFDESAEDKETRLVELFGIAATFIEQVMAEDVVSDFVLYCPQHFLRTLALANAIILRITKCDYNRHVDLQRGERSYFAAIQLIRKHSLQYNDLDAFAARLFTQMWQSSKVFISRDGTRNPLRVWLKSRGAIGIVYDIYWYWARESTEQKDPYSSKHTSIIPTTSCAPSTQTGPEVTEHTVFGYQFTRGDTPSDFSGSSDAMIYAFPPPDAFNQQLDWSPSAFDMGSLIYDFNNSQPS